MINKILTATDCSEDSREALKFACDLAERFDATVHIVHVPQGAAADRVMVLGGASIMMHAPRKQIEDAGRKLIESAVTFAKEHGCDNVTTELRAGDPANELVESAKENDADCIVIGSRGLGAFGSLVLGSVSYKVNNTAPCTCITVR
jgi:nucleotide-binding universal stress UspA family protein